MESLPLTKEELHTLRVIAAGQPVQYQQNPTIDRLIAEGYIDKSSARPYGVHDPVPPAALRLSALGSRYLGWNRRNQRSRMRDLVFYWITTAIALAALILQLTGKR